MQFRGLWGNSLGYFSGVQWDFAGLETISEKECVKPISIFPSSCSKSSLNHCVNDVRSRFFSLFYVHGKFQVSIIFHYFINLQEFVLRISVLSLRPIANTYTIYTDGCLEVGSHNLSCLTFAPVASDQDLALAACSTLLPPLLTEAKEAEGAQHSSPGQSSALYYFWNTS